MNTKTNKFYIGSSVNIRVRWNEHKSHLNRNIHKNKYLQSVWSKHSNWFFEFQILEYCEPEKLIEREQYYIDMLKPEYNLRLIAESNFGIKLTQETKNKISKANKGRKRTPEQIFRVAIKAIGNKSRTGQKLSVETRKKLSLVRIGNQNNRNHKKWPHELGCKCRCKECKRRWIDYYVHKKGVEF